MVLRVFEIGLNDIVIDIAHRKLCSNPRNSKGFEFQVDQGACGILREGLIHSDANFSARFHLPLYEVLLDNLSSQRIAHCLLLRIYVLSLNP